MKLLLTIVGAFFILNLNAQNATIKGKVTNISSGESVIGAKVELKPSAKPIRAKTDPDGNYTLSNVPYGDYTIIVSQPGEDSLIQSINVNQPVITSDLRVGKTIEYEEVEVVGNLVKERETPVAVTNIGKKEIQEELGSQDLPMILNSKPGVHATQQGGGDGDARITIRGFSQRNVGVMIDGVPVNDMENGWVYWSNWFGLDAITGQIQVQRGLGATKLAMPSVGGTMNILTQATGGKRQIKVRQEVGSGSFFRTSLSYKSGTLKNGWGVLFAGSYKQGNGWVDGLFTQGGFYYLKIQKRIKNHIISLSGFGAPQQHGQRSYSQPIEYWDSNYARNKAGIADSLIDADRDHGIRHNQHWGWITNPDGNKEKMNERRNYFHKPQITLKHFWKVNKKFSWSNIAYTSIGRGGGQRYFGSSSTISRDEEGLIDWDQIIYKNKWKKLFGTLYPTIDVAYDSTKLKSSQILSASVNNHFWVGGLSQYDWKINDKWKMAGGLDYRYYKGEHYTEILDLLGGEYFVNGSNTNAETNLKVVGDKISSANKSYQNDRVGLVQWAGAFAQAEYSHGRWAAFINASGVANFYKGIDYFRKKQLVVGDTTLEIGYKDTVTYQGQTYDRNSSGLKDHATPWVNKTGFTIKAGANFNITEKQNVYLNLGYLSRTPQFSNVIDNTKNEVFANLLNEKIMAAEVGYGFRSKKFSLSFNGYFTRWENRPLPFGLSIPDPNDPLELIKVNVPGMDALHYGGEIDFAWNILKTLTFEGMVSIGDWTWQSNETINVLGQDVSFYAKGVHVGDAAQSTYGASIRWRFVRGGYMKLKYTYFDRYYSDFDPNSLNEANAGRDSWRIPSYGLMSFHMGYRLKLEKTALVFKGNVFNLLDTKYISDARNNFHQDGSKNFDANSATVFFGQGVRFNLSLGFEF